MDTAPVSGQLMHEDRFRVPPVSGPAARSSPEFWKRAAGKFSRPLVLATCLAILLGGCGSADDESRTGRDSSSEEGREETRLIRNTESVGQAGDAVGDKVDAAIEANEQRTEQLDRQLGEE